METMHDHRTLDASGFYVSDFLDALHERLAQYGERAMRVQVDPRGLLAERDVSLLR